MKILSSIIIVLSIIIAQQDNLNFDESFDPSILKEPEIKLPTTISSDEPLPKIFLPTEIDSVIDGFRVQVLSIQDLNKANAIFSSLSSQFDSEVYIIYDSPNYKLRIGNYTSRVSAEKTREKLLSLGYSAPWIIKTKIKRSQNNK